MTEALQAFTVAQLHNRILAWHGLDVTVVGHPMLAMSRGSLGVEVRLHVDPGLTPTDAPLVVALMAAPDMHRVKRGEVVALRGRIKPVLKGFLELEGCTRVESPPASLPEPLPELSPASLQASPDTPVRADQLFDAVAGLSGQIVRVSGWFNGWTTSETGHRVVQRIDLHDAASGAEGVSAELREAPPEGLGRPGRIHLVQGRIGGTWANKNVLLTDAEIIASDV